MVAAAGADAIGLMFFKASKRAVDGPQAAKICQAVSCTRVGVFVDAQAATVDRVLNQCELDLLQFHGNESAIFCAQFGVPYMKVLRLGRALDTPATVGTTIGKYSDAWAVMLDTYVANQPGGTGKMLNRELWPRDAVSKLVLSGGLNASSVAAAIKEVSPHGVDVSGGVERYAAGELQHGHKDQRAVKQFIDEVRHA